MRYFCAVMVICVSHIAAAQLNCSNGSANPVNPTKGVLLTCSMAHQEFLPAAPVTLTRKFGVYIPSNYLPCDPAFPAQPCSGTILKIQGTTHRIQQDCTHASAQTENQGWLWFLDHVDAPAPVLVCPEGLFDQLTATVPDPGERWNSWTYGNRWNWRAIVASDGKTYSGNTQIMPNDDDFLVTLVRKVQATLRTDTNFSVITNDWQMFGNMVAYQLAALHPDLFNAVTVYGDPFGTNWAGDLASGYRDAYGPIPLPSAPISVLIITGVGNGEAQMCGGSKTRSNMNIVVNRSYTVDDAIAYWNTANRPDEVEFYPAGYTKFCKFVSTLQTAQTGLWRYHARNSQTNVHTEVWNLYGYREAPSCSFGPDGNVIPNMCALTHPPVDWRLVNQATHTPGNPYADSVLGFSLLQIEYNFMLRTRRSVDSTQLLRQLP